MISIIRSSDRGYADHGWLKSFHTFSFGQYQHPARPGFGNLRVINEDRVEAGRGFGTHSHRDMEIVSYVLDGELTHKDSIGNGAPGAAQTGVIRPGDVQRMSAGTGVNHSEANHSLDQITHFLQIWILPRRTGVAPSYAQKHFPPADRRGQLRLIVAEDGREGSVVIHADASIRAGLFDAGEHAVQPIGAGRLAYAHVVKGDIEVAGHRLSAGDAAAFDGEANVVLAKGRDAEVLVFDLAH